MVTITCPRCSKKSKPSAVMAIPGWGQIWSCPICGLDWLGSGPHAPSHMAGQESPLLLTNDEIAALAAIAYSKLNLTDSILDADINSAAAIAYSKLNLALSIVNADVNAAAAIAYSKLNLALSIVNADVNAGAAIAGTKINPDVTNAIIGVAAGYKIARGETAVTGTADIATGLTTVVQAIACLETDPSLEAFEASVADSGTAGQIILKVWKPTGAADCTPIAATVAKSVRWVAVGT